MKGVIFNLFEEYVAAGYGDVFLEDLYVEASLPDDVPPFIGPLSYPDDIFFDMVVYTAKKKNLNPEKLYFAFGRFSIPLLAKRFPIFFTESSSTMELMEKINDIHHLEVKKLYPDAELPHFKIEPGDDDSMTVHYSSHRHLCSLAKGLIAGVADHFGESVHTEEKSCMNDGDATCIFKISSMG